MREYIVASFKSRSQLVYFDGLLRKAGVKTEIISTPKRIAIGCGLSIKLSYDGYETAKKIYYSSNIQAFEGFFAVQSNGRIQRLL